MSEYIYATIGDPVANVLGEIFLPRCEVVRCRDCKSLVESSNPMSTTGYWCIENDTPRSLDGFCDWGERRAD